MNIPEEVRRARSGMVTTVKQTIAPQLFSHTVIFARTPVLFDGPPGAGMKYLVGSGTLVQVDAGDGRPRYGVLTCGHVLGAFEQSMEGARNESLTILVPNNGPGPEGPPWSMRMRYHKEMAIIEGARNEDSIGPDLALPVPHNCSLNFMKPLRYRGHHGDSKSGRAPPAGRSFPTSQCARRSRLGGERVRRRPAGRCTSERALGRERAPYGTVADARHHRRHPRSTHNAALRPYLYVHKGATQGFLALFRAWFILRTRRWGRHKGTSARQCLTGQRVHDWLTLLGYPSSPTLA